MTATTEDIAALRAAVAADPGPGGSSPRLVLADELDAIGVVRKPCPECHGTGRVYRIDGDASTGDATRCDVCRGDGSSAVLDHSAPVEAALQRVLAQPESDEYRLQYADAVEPVDKARAEFVRVQVELAHPQRVTPAEGQVLGVALRRLAEINARRERLEIRATELLDAHGGKWVGVDAAAAVARWEEPGCLVVPIGWDNREYLFRRGFLEAVTCTAADWLTHGATLLREHPVTRVNLLDVPDQTDSEYRFENIQPYRIHVKLARQWVTVFEHQWVHCRTFYGGFWAVVMLAAFRLRWPGVQFEAPAGGNWNAGTSPLTDIISAAQQAGAALSAE